MPRQSEYGSIRLELKQPARVARAICSTCGFGDTRDCLAGLWMRLGRPTSGSVNGGSCTLDLAGDIRRACRALPVDRSTYHYRSRRAGQAQLTERIREIAATRVCYGYRRIHVLLPTVGVSHSLSRAFSVDEIGSLAQQSHVNPQ
jgi:hypothetical protein